MPIKITKPNNCRFSKANFSMTNIISTFILVYERELFGNADHQKSDKFSISM